MSATRLSTRWACFSTLLATLMISAPAHAESAAKPAPFSTIGPQVSLSAAQVLDLQAKRAADLGAARPAAERQAKVTEPPTGVPLNPASVTGSRATTATLKPVVWKVVSPSLGRIPRPEWSTPWMKKEPDVTISRPLPVTVPATARGAANPGGSR